MMVGNKGVDVVPEELPTRANYLQDPFLDISDFFLAMCTEIIKL